jgi:carbon-monoxide dehydrogenase medium subunit
MAAVAAESREVAEDAQRGRRPTGSEIDDAAELVLDAVDPIDDVRGSADYKRDMARVWVARTLRDIAGATVESAA